MPRVYRVRRLDQLAALASPARLEIVEALCAFGPSPAARLAAALGRPADALYYHLRELVRVGLAVASSPGHGPRRPETLFRAVAPRIAVAYDPGSPGNVARVNRIAGSLLRIGARDFRRAFRSGNVVVSGPRREIWVGRVTGRLRPERLETANRLLGRLAALFDPEPSPGKRAYAVTFLLVPVDPVRRPRRGRNTRRPAKRSRQ